MKTRVITALFAVTSMAAIAFAGAAPIMHW